uniref:Uncharacterized protein n=1 Tax=Caenorhabditis japonica TaxID=281687 RepID=A0A8R1E4R9_CAEJA
MQFQTDKLEEKCLPNGLPPKSPKHRKHKTQAEIDAELVVRAKKILDQQKSDTSSSQFKNKGRILFPLESSLDMPSIPTNVTLDEVWYDPAQNELYDVGTDVDSIKVKPSLSTGGSTTEEEPIENNRAHGVVNNNFADRNVASPSGTTSKLTSKSSEGPAQ